MQRLIILRGPMGSGKTTVANHYRNFNQRWAALHVDQFKHIFEQFEKETRPVVHGAVTAVLEYLLNGGFSVVMEGVLQDLTVIEAAVSVGQRYGVTAEVFELYASPETLVRRDQSRPEVKAGNRTPLGESAINSIRRKLLEKPHPPAVRIDTDKLDIEAVVAIIEGRVGGF